MSQSPGQAGFPQPSPWQSFGADQDSVGGREEARKYVSCRSEPWNPGHGFRRLWDTERRPNAETEQNGARVLAQFGVAEVLNGPHDVQVAGLQWEWENEMDRDATFSPGSPPARSDRLPDLTAPFFPRVSPARAPCPATDPFRHGRFREPRQAGQTTNF